MVGSFSNMWMMRSSLEHIIGLTRLQLGL
ncbi:hypothetical protein LINPERHAP1_LOCUS20555 [Linum perenne]